MAQLPVFETRRDARRFLLGLCIFVAGVPFWIASLSGGPSHVSEGNIFWFFNIGIGLEILGGFVANGALLRAYTATQRQIGERLGATGNKGTRWRATKAIYSRAGFREAIRVARLPEGRQPS